MVSLMCKLKKKNKKKTKPNQNRLIETEINLMIARMEGSVRMGEKGEEEYSQ